MTIIVKQFILTHDQYNLVNSPEGSEFRLEYFDIGMGNVSKKMYDQYKVVAEVDSNNLTETFELMNVWNQPEKITVLNPHHSLSVGDILVKDNVEYVVDNIGFKKLEFTNDQ